MKLEHQSLYEYKTTNKLLRQRPNAIRYGFYWMLTTVVQGLVQITEFAGVGTGGIVTSFGLKFAGILNLSTLPLYLVYLYINYRSLRYPEHIQIKVYRISTMIILLLIWVSGIAHTHNGGASSSVITGFLIIIVMSAAWFLANPEFLIFAIFAFISSAVLLFMEVSGIIGYAPMFANSEVLSPIFLDKRVYLSTFFMVSLWASFAALIVRYFRMKLEEANKDLELKVIERTKALEEALENDKQLRLKLENVGRIASLGELTASIAHELNQPLAAILNNARAGSKIASLDNPDIEDIKETFDDIAQDNTRAAEAIKSLRRLFKGDEPDQQNVNLEIIISEITALVEQDLKKHNIALSINSDENPNDIFADRVQIGHLLINLLRNSIDSISSTTTDNRKIEILSRNTDSDMVELTVRDTGSGFSEEMLPKIFESFVTNKSDGLGIGLSLCATIAKQHGGSIKASNHPDGGAMITVLIPQVKKGSKK